MPSPDPRAQLADMQRRLATSLVTGRADVTLGIDASSQTRASHVVRSKRMRTLAHAWPELIEALGMRVGELIQEYACDSDRPLGVTEDARRFGRWLDVRVELPDVAVPRWVAFELRAGRRAVIRRVRDGVCVGLRLFGNRRRVVVLQRPRWTRRRADQ